MSEAKAPSPQGKTPDEETAAFLAELDLDFGKKKRGASEAAHKGLNKAFHQANQPLGKASGKAPERLNPEDSTQWQPIARVTYVVIQECASCNDATDFIGGEYIKFRSVKRFGGEILRRSENCPNLFLMHQLEEPLEDLVEWHYQKVSRCPGCIRVDQQAQAIIWDQAQQEIVQAELPLKAANDEDITLDGLDEALK